MKKSLLALAVLASFASAASAQSSVTLFGGLDLNLRYAKSSGATLKTMGTDGIYSSRWGVRGVEDLGGGLKAGFWLEAAINPDAGTTNAARYWHRRTSVSLMGDFGEVRLGRYLTNQFTAYADFDPFGTNGVGDVNKMHQFMGSGVSSGTRADNIVGYFLPGNLGGIYGSAEVAAGEGAIGNKYVGVRLGYAAGPLNVSGAFANVTAGGSDFKRTTFSGSYDLGVAKLTGAYTQGKWQARKQTVVQIGALVPVGSTGTFKASYTSGNANTAAEAVTGDSKQFAVGYIHDLSKRSALYGTLSRVSNSGRAAVGVSGSPTVRAGQASTGFEVGVKHTF
ncbi:porin [Roseateles toxinivorans]|uniref:Putative porin n=1 Tax=Roseateles toxinivorans TaxID=270368 RepID=A0A4R6QIJ8_9BURK|nr:porin [Roseateles toxinivorans]TDP62758.1 putative porin [Roseateles toxinivorans]